MPAKRGKKGKGIKKVVRAVNKFVKKNKIVSRGADFLVQSGLAGAYAPGIARAGAVAKKLGYGKKRHAKIRFE